MSLSKEEIKAKIELYADIRKRQAELEKEAESLQPVILEYLVEKKKEIDPGKPLVMETEFGSFSLVEVRQWVYPEAVAGMKETIKKEEARLKKAQQDAQQRGTATCTVKPHFRFDPPESDADKDL